MSFTDGIDAYCCAFEAYMNKDTIQDLRREIDEMTCLVNGFRSENDRLKEENAKLYLSNKELKEENKRLEETNINLDNEISELEKEQDDLKQEYKIAIDENNFFIEENARLEEEIKELKEENDELKEQVKCLAECCNKLNDDYCKLKEAKEVKVYKEFDVEEFFKRFGANVEISLSPYTEPSITAYATDLSGVDLLRYSAGYTGRKFDDLFAPLYKYLASSPIERVVIAKELDKIREAYNNLEAKYNSICGQIDKYNEELNSWRGQGLKVVADRLKAKITITNLEDEITKLKKELSKKNKYINKLKNPNKQSETDA